MTFEPPFPPPGPEGPPPPPPPADPGGAPWERRGEIGFAAALVETTQQVLLRPTEFFSRMPVAGGIGSPLLYAVILGYLGLVAATLYNLVFSSIMGSSFRNFGGRYADLERFQDLLEGGVGATIQLVTGPLWIVVGAFVGAGILHLLLLVLGAANRDFEATFRVVCYSHAINIINLVPFCGSILALVAWIVIATIGLKEVHHTSTAQALAAVLLPLLLCCCCCAAVIIAAAGGMASLFQYAQ
jgi:hypothetical protein